MYIYAVTAGTKEPPLRIMFVHMVIVDSRFKELNVIKNEKLPAKMLV